MKYLAVSILILVILAACSNEGTPTPVGSLDGQRLFLMKGCAACHGSRQEGSIIAPSLIGYTASQIKQQIRAPSGAMPLFPPSKISNQELDEIARFVESLENGVIDNGMDSPREETMRKHWMILLSLVDGSPDDAIRHADDIIETVTGPHRA